MGRKCVILAQQTFTGAEVIVLREKSCQALGESVLMCLDTV